MRVLVTFAIEAEFDPWRRRHNFQRLSGGAVNVYLSQIGEVEVCGVLTGIGCRKAWVQAIKAIWPEGADICISSGFAGALRPVYAVGDILVARQVWGQTPGVTLWCDKPLVELAAGCGATPVGVFLTRDQVVVEAAQKRRLGAEADAVEMESACVLSEAASFGARCVAIRSISDSVNEDLPIDFNRTTSKSGDVDKVRLLSEIVRFRSNVFGMFRLFEYTRVARENLADFLTQYIERLIQVSGEPQLRAAAR